MMNRRLGETGGFDELYSSRIDGRGKERGFPWGKLTVTLQPTRSDGGQDVGTDRIGVR